MGLASFVSKQFIDVIQWTEDGDDVLAWRFPTADLEIQHGAALIVRDTQTAIFVDDGQLADRFEGGRYVLRTKNLPVLTNLRNWTKLFESPFKSEVYFFSTRLRVGQTFGTPAPVTVRDAEFGAVQVRAFGVYSFRIADPARFHQQVSGTRDEYRVADLEGQLRAILLSALGAELGKGIVPFLDLAANQHALAAAVCDRAASDCAALGIQVATVQLESLTLPDELQKRLEERIGMGITGDPARYVQFQTARSIPLAAASEGGAAGAGVGLGAGVAFGQVMAQGMTSALAAAGGAARSAAAATCPHCQATLDRTTRFCPECGKTLG